jgi:hypothetical protein
MLFLTYAKLQVPSRLASSFEKVRASVERDDFFTPEIKKLTGRPFFRAKLDYENRLLLQFVEHAGKKACLALELIEQHGYDRSRFLRGARVDEARGLSPQPVNLLEAGEGVVPVRYLHPGRPEFHVLDHPISFDDHQAKLFALPLPVVLVGCAGSGKTAVTLTKLRELRGDVLYVTQSAYLAESAASLYFAHGYENETQNVDFLSYRALLEGVEVPAGQPVTLRHFRALFKRHEATLRFTTAHQLFEELRGVVSAHPKGLLSEAEYLALGVRQSIYPPEARAKVYAFFAKYRAWLEEDKLYDSNLVAQAYRARAERKYDAVVVDEVQDLTNAELALVLAMLKVPESFLLCGDANQIVHPNFFSWSKVKSLFYSHEEAAVSAPIHVLEMNYRSSRAVCRVANNLLKVKNARFGSIDRESTALVRAASGHDGHVVGLAKKDGVLRDLNQRTRGSAKVAIIVLSDEQKAEARQRFATPLIFSVHEAKGLEYETVVLFDLVSTEREHFREIAEGVLATDLDRDELTYARARDKGDKSLEVYKFFVNALYVALTRAVDTVYVVESDTSHPLLGLLRIPWSDDLSLVSAQASSLEEWQKEARKLELQGKQEQADAIRKNILRVAPVPWPLLDRAGFRQAYDRAFAPGSVFGKAKQHLFEFGAFHGLDAVCMALARVGYRHPRSQQDTAEVARERAMGAYLAGDRVKVIADVDRYGLEHRCMMGLTPLMMAADAGNLALVEMLSERGARLDEVDSLGRMPIHFALRRGFADARFAEETLGAMYELLCPTAIEIEVDGRRERLSRSQGEFLVLLLLVARFHELYRRFPRRNGGFTARMIDEAALASFPRSVVPDRRRRREYWNGVLARGEVESTYRPARKLWQRERMGHYLPSAAVAVRVAGEREGAERYVGLSELLAERMLDGVP